MCVEGCVCNVVLLYMRITVAIFSLLLTGVPSDVLYRLPALRFIPTLINSEQLSACPTLDGECLPNTDALNKMLALLDQAKRLKPYVFLM